MSGQVYQWFVKRGRVGLWVEQDHCMLELEGECTLTLQDVHDISGILGVLAHGIWEARRADVTPEVSTYRHDGAQRYSWGPRDGEARLEIWSEEEPEVYMRSGVSGAIALSLTMAVEVVQVLDHHERQWGVTSS